MTGMNSLMLPCSQSEINALYKRIYQCLKSQRTILTHIFESSNNDLNELYKRSLKCILSVGYDSLFQKSSVIFDEINHFLTTNSSIPEDNERIGYTILASLLSINKITSLIRYTTENYFPNSMYDQEQNFNLKMMASSTLNNKERVFKETLNDECLKNISSSKLTNLSDSFNSLATIICRICDREVSLDTIETHSKSCAKAYLSSKTIRTVEDRMRKLQVLAQQTILRVEWPYEEDFSITNIIPILHVIVILDKAIECDSSAKYELTQMVELLNMLKIIPNLKKQKRNFDKAITLIMEKCSLTKELEDALDVVKLTTNNQLVEDYVSTDVTIDEFDFIKKISSGAFSRVYLTRKSQTGDLSATKAIPRTSLKQMNDVQRVLVEKNILSKVTSEYMITFFFSIIGKNNLYLVMEYCPGGDLFSVLRGVGRLNENAAAIYTSQIVAALEFLRFNSVIHRDLKPDNILVCSNGRLKLTDFGLSVFGSYERSITETNDSNDSTESFGSIVGTPDYISPEIILQQKHSFTADYWSLGCIVYEFLVGVPPFHQDTPTETFARALNGIYEPLQSFHNDNISEEAIDFVSRLLQQDPSKRLGYKSIEEIKQHPWFAKNDIDWHNLDKLIPPFVPQLDNDEDTSYFEERYQWKDDNEQDILEDITVSSLNLSKKMSSSFFSENNPNYSFTDPDDDLSSFPSLSTGSLNSLNKVETEKKRRSLRASSFSEKNLWPNTPLDEENSVLIESKSFNQYDATPRKKPKQRKKYALNATSHSFFEKLVISPTSKCNKSDEF